MLLLHGQEYVRKRQQDAPQAGICPEETAGDTIGNTQVGTYPEEAEEHQQEAAGCSIGRNISGGGRGTSTGDSGMLLLHGQEYIRKMQQDAPQAGIYSKRQRDKY